MKKGMKTTMAVISECVGPRCIWMLKRKLRIMSISGMIESTRITGMLIFTLRSFADALLSR